VWELGRARGKRRTLPPVAAPCVAAGADYSADGMADMGQIAHTHLILFIFLVIFNYLFY
jgi:hypothetical protein